MKVKKLERVVPAWPSTWKGVTETGDEIYVKYRHGILLIYINSEIVYSTVGGPYDGYMGDGEMIRHLKDAGFVFEEV